MRSGVSVGGVLELNTAGPKVTITMGLGTSAVQGQARASACSPRKASIGPFKCLKSVAAAFTLFCKDFDFSTGDNDAPDNDPCAKDDRVYSEFEDGRRRSRKYVRRRQHSMEGQGQTTEESQSDCRERCNNVAGCAHYSFWPRNGNCELQSSNSELTRSYRGAKTGPPVCCAVSGVWWAEDENRRRRANLDEDTPKDVTKHIRRRRDGGSESTLEKCQERCQNVAECQHFTYWSDGKCRFTGSWIMVENHFVHV